MGSDHGHEHGPSCNHDHGKDHGHDHGHEHGAACSHDHAHDHADDHGHHGGEEFVPKDSLHDKFLVLCATVCAFGLAWMMYYWAFGMPLAAVTEHEGGSAHTEMMEESGGLGKESEHASDATKIESAAPHTETTAPSPTSAETPAPASTETAAPASTETAAPASTETAAPAPAEGTTGSTSTPSTTGEQSPSSEGTGH